MNCRPFLTLQKGRKGQGNTKKRFAFPCSLVFLRKCNSKVAHMQPVVFLDPRLNFLVGGVFALKTCFALIVVDIDYEGEHVAVYGEFSFRKGVRIPHV